MGDTPEADKYILLMESKVVQGTVDGVPLIVACVMVSGQNLPLFPLKPKAINLSVGGNIIHGLTTLSVSRSHINIPLPRAPLHSIRFL